MWEESYPVAHGDYSYLSSSTIKLRDQNTRIASSLTGLSFYVLPFAIWDQG